MKNVYDGVVVLNDTGSAEIELPDWFGVLNKDFRYQLTPIGSPGPNLYIAEEISDTTKNNSRFKIAAHQIEKHCTATKKRFKVPIDLPT